MSKINDGGAAFPREDYQVNDAPGQRGMSLRAYFAGQALAGLIGSGAFSNSGMGFEEFIAIKAVNTADAMIAELAKEPS